MNTISITNPETNETIIYSEAEVSKYIRDHAEAATRISNAQDDYQKVYKELRDLRVNIYDLFNGAYTSGDDDITISVEEINEFLAENNCDTLKRTFSASIRIYANVNGIEASSEDEAKEMIMDNIEVSYSYSDSDIWVDDIEVSDIAVE